MSWYFSTFAFLGESGGIKTGAVQALWFINTTNTLKIN